MPAAIKIKKCTGSLAATELTITGFSDHQILEGIAQHADPAWWRRTDIRRNNQAYLRRWGAILRREARRRGLL